LQNSRGMNPSRRTAGNWAWGGLGPPKQVLNKLARGIPAEAVGYWIGPEGQGPARRMLCEWVVVFPVLLSIGYGATELPACRFGKPLGFTEKEVMGPFAFALAHYPKPQAIRMQTAVESNASKELCRMCAEIEHQTPTKNDERRWRHSGEFGKGGLRFWVCGPAPPPRPAAVVLPGPS
jgi:hypothetical protein